MKILVTGGLGMVGRPVVDRLVKNGHHVRIMDRSEGEFPTTVEFVAGDITEFNSVREAVRKIDAVIHLAAIPNPAGDTGSEIFRINCAGTFNVYEAAAQEGIRRVVCASSINALGFNYGTKSFPIEYLPVDEDHPLYTTDPYSFSKQITEEIGSYYWRREGISGVHLRLPGVLSLTEEFRAMVRQFAPLIYMAADKVRGMPEAQRKQRAKELIAEHDERRALRFHEKPRSFEMPEGVWQPDMDDPLPLVAFGFSDFWAVITGENSAQAFEKGVMADYEGSHALFVADAVNLSGLDAEILANTFFPDAIRKRPLVGKEPLVSFERAKALIDYDPESTMEEWLKDPD